MSVFIRYCWTALWALSFIPLFAPFLALCIFPNALFSPAAPYWLIYGGLMVSSVAVSHRIWDEKTSWRWAPVFFSGGCVAYLAILQPLAPLLLVGFIAGYWLLGKVYARLGEWTSQAPKFVRKLAAAMIRAVREVAIVSAVGFGFVLMSQIYVVVWSLFHRDGIWLWERLARGLARLPHLDWRLVAGMVLGLAAVSLLNPKSSWVRRATTAVKIYKKCLAMVAIVASFTFLSSASLAKLHHELLIKHRHPETQPEKMVDPVVTSRRTAYLVSRIQSATPSERIALKKEFLALENTRDEGQEEAAAERLARDLDPVQAAHFVDEDGARTGSVASRAPEVSRSDARQTTTAHADRYTPAEREAIYAECRLAVISSLKDAMKAWFNIHVDNDIVDPFADNLLGSFRSTALDAVIPENLNGLGSMRTWVSRHMQTVNVEIPTDNVEPNWDALAAEAGIQTIKLSAMPTVVPLEGRPIGPEGIPEPEVVIPERPVFIP